MVTVRFVWLPHMQKLIESGKQIEYSFEPLGDASLFSPCQWLDKCNNQSLLMFCRHFAFGVAPMAMAIELTRTSVEI